MDKVSAEQRHRNMAAIRSKDTKPEWVVRRGLWSRDFRYRLNSPRLPGHPDLVLRKYRTCIFVNGCFWHGHNVVIDNSQLEIEDSEDESRVLGGEDSAEPAAGRGGAAAVGRDGVALHHGVGVRADDEAAGRDAALAGLHAE